MIEEKVTTLYLPYPGREDRPVRVYVPAHERGETLPVIYMTDGQNLFDEESSSFGCWHTREAVRAEVARSGRGAIIVGIHNDDPWRMNELTPASVAELEVPEEAPYRLEPQAERFDEFLINVVMTAVEKRFPVRRGRKNTAFCGSSAGGTFSFFTAMSHPDRFCAAAALSPCFAYFRQEELFSWIRGRMQDNPPYLYVYCGAGDPLEKLLLPSVKKTLEVLRGCMPAGRLHEVILPAQRHHETAWEPIFRDFLHIFLTRGDIRA